MGGEVTDQVQPRARARTIEHPEYPALLDDLRAGAFFEVACAARGIVSRSVLAACEDDETAAAELAAARAEGVKARLAALELSDDWKREAWLLERHTPKVFHLPTKVTGVKAEDGGAPITPATPTLDEMTKVRDALDAEIAKAKG
jgi:hypothetical protein